MDTSASLVAEVESVGPFFRFFLSSAFCLLVLSQLVTRVIWDH